jgi:hypothetical protein
MSKTLEALNRHVTALAEAESPSDVFKILLEAGALAAPRTAIFLVRQGVITGWASRGYPPDPAKRFRHLKVERESWLGRVVGGGSSDPVRPGHGEGPPDFEQPPAQEIVAAPLRVSNRTVAVVLAESDEIGPSETAEVLGAIVAVARLRLELDLALRRMREARSTEEEASGGETSSAPPGSRTASSALESSSATALTPAPEKSSSDDARRDEARRFARLVATDIRLYNEESVMLGRQHGDLGERLAEQLHQGEQTFLRRFPEMGDEGAELLRDAYVQVLCAGDPDALASKQKT